MRYLLIPVLSLCFLFIASAQSGSTDSSDIPLDITAGEASSFMSVEEFNKLKKDEDRIHVLFDGVEKASPEEMAPLLDAMTYYKHNEEGETLLTKAIKLNRVEMADLIAKKAVINIKNKEGETPLTLALKSSNKQMIDIIMKRAKAGFKNDAGEAPLYIAIDLDDLQLLQDLIDKGADVNRYSNGETPLTKTVKLGKMKAVALLVKNDADVNLANEDGTIPLYWAVKSGDPVISGILLYKSDESDLDANWTTSMGETLANIAIEQNAEQIVRLLLDYGADPDGSDYLENTGLIKAAEKGLVTIVEIYLIKGADPELPNIMGTTPIMAAAQNNHSSIATMLAEQGANPDRQNFEGIAANDFGSYQVLTDQSITDQVIEMTDEE